MRERRMCQVDKQGVKRKDVDKCEGDKVFMK